MVEPTLPADDPLLVETTRGDMVESRHHGACAVVDAAGRVVLAWGAIDRPVFPRSAIKPLQALPLIETGAADAYGLGAKELALACASHHGEAVHVAAVTAWLARLGLGAQDLECGVRPPIGEAAFHALIREGRALSALHNNCSGKHAGFLTAARHRGEPGRGYVAWDHPVQRRVRAALEGMTGLDLSRAPRGIDGCGIPVIAIPLSGLARAMARLADPQGLAAPRAQAGKRLLDAMGREPLMLSGSGSFTSQMMAALGGKLRLKSGAEGVFCAVLPEQGLGIALKIADGVGRAAEVALGAVLARLGAIDETEQETLQALLRPPIRGAAGQVVGELRPAAALTN